MGVRKPHKGFTVVELMVVIAIIAILAAILYPVFGAARERSRMVACSSNCRQIYLAFRMYTQDWERFPPHDDLSYDFFSAPEFLMPYAKEESVFCCPSDSWSLWPDRRLFPDRPVCMTRYGECAVLNEGLFEAAGTSYLWNVALSEMAPDVDRSLNSPEQVGPGYDPAKLFWAFDSFRNHMGNNRSWEDGSARRAILFADGHVEMADRDRTQEVFRSMGYRGRMIW
jgi:prepilin-type N-terminal cleavage/methylation domain-containing protein/prepilin-type processing-associated H-X9-DG protein